MEYVVLVNRSSKSLKGTWDGRHYDIAPGKHEFPKAQAEKFKEQNPIMGSENPYTMVKQYLIGIEQNGDDCTPIEQSGAVELIDRKVTGDADNVVVLKGHGRYSQRDAAPLPSNNTGFVAPNS